MNEAWYSVLSMVFGYLASGMLAVIVLLAARRMLTDRALWRRVKKGIPTAGAAGMLQVLSAGSRRLPAGTMLPVPYEGTMGAAHSCDVCIPYRKVHLRSAFFWMEKGELHMAALHRDGFLVDDVPVEPGDEAVLRDGAVLRVGDLKMALLLSESGADGAREADIGPYVTTARRSKAQRGRGEGIGAPGQGEIRREQKLQKKRQAPRKQTSRKQTTRKQTTRETEE